jgi:hypothetical protein
LPAARAGKFVHACPEWRRRIGGTARSAAGGDVVMAPDRPDRPRSFDCQVGEKVHEHLAELARRGERPEGEALFEEVSEVLRLRPYSGRCRPGPQRLATLLAIALEMMPPVEWAFLGAEVPCSPGRIDLMWRAPANFGPAPHAVIVDEVKVGAMPGHLSSGEVTEQMNRYVRFGVKTFGLQFVGLRLIALSCPASSLFYRPRTTNSEPLARTPYWFGPRPGEVL